MASEPKIDRVELKFDDAIKDFIREVFPAGAAAPAARSRLTNQERLLAFFFRLEAVVSL